MSNAGIQLFKIIHFRRNAIKSSKLEGGIQAGTLSLKIPLQMGPMTTKMYHWFSKVRKLIAYYLITLISFSSQYKEPSRFVVVA